MFGRISRPVLAALACAGIAAAAMAQEESAAATDAAPMAAAWVEAMT